MIITATTPTSDIYAPIQSAKARLADMATKAVDDGIMNGERLVSAAQDVRNAEAVAYAQLRFQHMLQEGPKRNLSPEAVRDILVEHLFDLVAKTDDTWSGRGNDSKRSEQDAVREWAKAQAARLF